MRNLAGLVVLLTVALPFPARASSDEQDSHSEAVGRDGTAGGAPPQVSRVRSDDPAVAAAIRTAATRSATFGRLITAVDATDGIVYVKRGKCRHNVRACLAMWVKVAGPSRILQILVDGRKQDTDLMASIGHELQHAVEILGNPSVTSGFALYWFYEREASHRPSADLMGGAFETKAAIEAGFSVRGELESYDRRAKSR
jgi:hypothetical protein